ncbi:hypothetical protein [Oribacterium sp. FC2011]|uniref:hypothetical protein n=1 Tax=Oribacterium sp. FC2011 TaxID=1408311 RepID=UPI0004E23796|nr:hypothetical protein [Oribacterium sp. FC2011]
MPEDKVKKNKRHTKWVIENRDRINLLFRMGTKDRIDQAATAVGLSKSQWVQNAIDQQIKREQDGDEIPPLMIDSLIEWLKNHGHKEQEILDCIKFITDPERISKKDN